MTRVVGLKAVMMTPHPAAHRKAISRPSLSPFEGERVEEVGHAMVGFRG